MMIAWKQRSFLSALIAALALVLVLPHAGAVIFYSSGDPNFNDSAPGGAYAGSGWQWTGGYQGGGATIVSPNQILTADHLGYTGTAGFSYQSNFYDALSAYNVPGTDLLLVDVDTSTHGDFTSWAPLYSVTDEVGKDVVVVGRGATRGNQVREAGDNELKGWKYLGNLKQRWGTNTIEQYADLLVATDEKLVYATFDAAVGGNEAHLANWDSGGGMFILGGGEWKLAGVHIGVDAGFNTTNSGTGFTAALFDAGGIYYDPSLPFTGPWALIPDQVTDIPTGFYSSRVAIYYNLLTSRLTPAPPIVPEPATAAIALLMAGAAFLRRPDRSR